jgi:hypothetical protein
MKMDGSKVKILLELLAVAAVSTSAMAGASKSSVTVGDGGLPEIVRSSLDGGMAQPEASQVVSQEAMDGGY